MSIFNVNPDPDMPVLSGPGFAQYTYQPYTQNAGAQQFYYNGATLQPAYQPQTQPMGYPTDSRRYDAPTPALSSIPQQQQIGFNQLVESRRTQTGQPGGNPWAVQGMQQQQMQQPQQMQVQYVPVPAPAVQTVTYPAGYSALCSCHPSFDKKKSAWGDQQVYNPLPAPMVDWSGVAAQPMQTQYAYNVPQMTYPQPVMTQPVQQSWEEIAQQNFGMK